MRWPRHAAALLLTQPHAASAPETQEGGSTPSMAHTRSAHPPPTRPPTHRLLLGQVHDGDPLGAFLCQQHRHGAADAAVAARQQGHLRRGQEQGAGGGGGSGGRGPRQKEEGGAQTHMCMQAPRRAAATAPPARAAGLGGAMHQRCLAVLVLRLWRRLVRAPLVGANRTNPPLWGAPAAHLALELAHAAVRLERQNLLVACRQQLRGPSGTDAWRGGGAAASAGTVQARRRALDPPHAGAPPPGCLHLAGGRAGGRVLSCRRRCGPRSPCCVGSCSDTGWARSSFCSPGWPCCTWEVSGISGPLGMPATRGWGRLQQRSAGPAERWEAVVPPNGWVGRRAARRARGRRRARRCSHGAAPRVRAARQAFQGGRAGRAGWQCRSKAT